MDMEPVKDRQRFALAFATFLAHTKVGSCTISLQGHLGNQ
jgi:hypothetical protein